MRKIYLDGASNTPLDKKVYKAMKPYLKGFKGNSSSSHSYGIAASAAIEESRENIANLLGVTKGEVYFTSGATEGNNWVIQSLCLHEYFSNNLKRNRIICTATEHSSVYNTCLKMKEYGFDVQIAPVDSTGKVSLTELRRLVNNKTLFVCLMAINNETGVKNKTSWICKLAHRAGAYVLCDCTQKFSFGGLSIKLGEIYKQADYLTFSAHKFYGPMGIGCLICRKKSPIYPFIIGSETSMRAGTENVPAIVGMSAALTEISKHDYFPHYEELYNYFNKKMDEFNDENGTHLKLNVKNPYNLSIINIDCSSLGDFTDLPSMLDINYNIACSSGAACSAADREPSHVLLTMGIDHKVAKNSLRISFTKYNTTKDIDALFKAFKGLYQLMSQN